MILNALLNRGVTMKDMGVRRVSEVGRDALIGVRLLGSGGKGGTRIAVRRGGVRRKRGTVPRVC
jgi:hypothetical protein